MTIDNAPSSAALTSEFATVSSLLRHANEAAAEITQNANQEAEAIIAEAKRLESEARLVYRDAEKVRSEADALQERAEESFTSAKTDAERMVKGASEQAELLLTSAQSH